MPQEAPIFATPFVPIVAARARLCALFAAEAVIAFAVPFVEAEELVSPAILSVMNFAAAVP